MLVPNRHEDSNLYRYGFNGKEKDDEVKGGGNSYDFGARLFDSRIGRFFSIDDYTKKFAEISPYSFASNNPIKNIDYNGNYTVEVHYEIAYNAALKAGYSKEMADKIAYMASTYADHPDPKILGMKKFGMTFNGGKELKYGRFGVAYGKGKTAKSQDDTSASATWHSMRSTQDVIDGMSAKEAKERGMSFGWDMVLEAGATGDVHSLGQGIHALQDADAHEGASMHQHLGTDEDGDYTSEAKKMLYNDAFGDTYDAERWSNTALTVYGLLQGDEKVIKKSLDERGNIKLDFTGVSDENIEKVQSALAKKGYIVSPTRTK
jgi:RHS repeat-associated protein